MDFDGNQPIRILFWNDEMMFTKQKHMAIKKAGKGKSVVRARVRKGGQLYLGF
jgi:hypothetical protein